MDVAVVGTLIPMVLIISVVVMIIYIRRYENQERMAMIEKGITLDLSAKKNQLNPSVTLRFSLLLIGSGLGLLLGYLLDEAYRMDSPVAYFSMIFIFGGLGLGAAYLVEERKARLNQR
jgi:hypothetical protein